MKLCELDMHCGECTAIEFCGAGFGYAICIDSRFSNVDDAEYAKIAESCPPFDGYPECAGCDGEECWECDYDDGQRDYNAEHFAEYAYQKIFSQEQPEGNKQHGQPVFDKGSPVVE